jgi:hypothetical protein
MGAPAAAKRRDALARSPPHGAADVDDSVVERHTGGMTTMDMMIEPPAGSVTDRVAPIARQIWDAKYRLKDAAGTPIDRTIEDRWRPAARALAQAEAEPERWE